MRSPLSKRFPRELYHNAGKYLGIFSMMVLAISLTSGFLMAANSIAILIDDMDARYVIEDGRLTTRFEPSNAALDKAAAATKDEATGEATIYPLLSFDLSLNLGTDQSETSADAAAEDETASEEDTSPIARVYAVRDTVDVAAYAEGRAPQSTDEISFDRVFCAHQGITVGDSVELDGRRYVVSGIMTLPDYSALFEKNSDFVFNSISFTVAEVTQEAFDQIREDGREPSYTYAFTFQNEDASDAERTDAESTLVESLSDSGVYVSDLLDKSVNQGIGYPADDVDSDSVMWETLLMILIAIMSFMFVVLVGSTIEEESAIIGTLLASGWRKRELVFHYAAMPCAIGIVAAAVGNFLGFIALAEPMKNLYYNSYSLPPYVAVWSWKIFALTTLAPLALLIGITLLGLVRKMRCSPLQFLRHETSRRASRRGVALPERLGFVARFRLRVFLCNLGNFLTLFLGISFASLLLLFGLCVLPTMTQYADQLREEVVAVHMYSLKAPLELEGSTAQRQAQAAAEELTDAQSIGELGLAPADLIDRFVKASTVDENAIAINTLDNSEEAIAQAEKYAVTSLDYARPEGHGTESTSVYGVSPNSAYWDDLDVGAGRVYASEGFMDKFGLEVGQQITLEDTYAGKSYELTISGSYGSLSAIAVYMSLDDYNTLFDNDADYFNAYASNEALAIDERYLANDLTPDAMDKIGAQMTNSMGSMMNMLLGLAVAIFIIFMYLLTKTIIDRSARSISYLKVFGYRDREINHLYIRSITITVVVSLIACLPLIITGISMIFKNMLMDYNGNILVYVPNYAMVLSVAAGIASYAVVAMLHMRRIKKVPLEIALKMRE